jgi:hypothetical protein
VNIDRKVHSTAILKNLPREKHLDIIHYLDGPGGNNNKAAAAWLRGDGIPATAPMVGEFVKWYYLREEFRARAEFSLDMAKECKEQGWLKTAGEERAAAQIFFNRLALNEQDPKIWSMLERVNLLRDKVVLDKSRLGLQKKKFKAKYGKPRAKKSTMTADEKQARIRQILGVD